MKACTRMKTANLSMLTLMVCHALCGDNQIRWQESIYHHQSTMNKKTHELLIAQYTTYAQGAAPKIAEPAIKNIPIIESEEPLVDVNTMNDPRIAMLPAPDHAFASPDCHSGFAASSKIRRTVFVKLQEMIKQLDLLAPYFGYKPGQIDIRVFEGLRDLQTQDMLFNNKAQEIHAANPTMTEEEVFSETSKWVSPVRNNIPVHSTGGAVDIRLWDNHAQQFMDMGPFGVIWGKNTIAPTFSEDLTDVQRNNRLYQIVAATQAGLINYLYEYWHFSSGDRYASFWQEHNTENRKALYGPIK